MNIGEYDQMLAEMLNGAELRWHLIVRAEAEKRELRFPEAELRPVLAEYMAGHFVLTWQLWRHKVVLLARARANGELGQEHVEANMWALYVEMSEAARTEFEHYIDLRLLEGVCVSVHCGCGTDWREV
ncbi:hypothetical protein [Nesterenkonia sandarakina]|uniref:Uncharacterized protein n=1 Tax=Nesterenkonia sandarakina TaxID=272918 RepID=A0A2T0YSG0_9MICC|nr:hypothetical protein [Nesterenkonia sandarakina]PRZ18700.1 hypothetical protein BCL67_1016 [Nesterenkonia sandarakina]